MWVRLFEEFGKDFTIIAPDLPGIGDSEGTSAVRDKKTAARHIRDLVKSLGYEKIDLIGHDIGLMVAYAYAAQYPGEVKKLALLEAPIPGIGEAWPQIYNDPRLWHFHFVDSAFSLPLVKGRERIFLDHFWEEMTPNSKAMPEESRIIYTKSYAQPGVMEAAFDYFKAFDRQDAADNRLFAATKLKMPVLTIAGEKSMGPVLGTQAKLVAENVTSTIIPATGHWLLEEKPTEVKAALRAFFAN
jgi:pimeloyl-ACP methyl ester carboxylesterase